MNCFEGYLSITSLFDHHVQTSVMNVDCTRKGTLFLPSYSCSYFYLTMWCILSIFFSLSCSISVLIIYKCARCMRMFGGSIVIYIVRFCSSFDHDLFFSRCHHRFEYNNEHKKERKKIDSILLLLTMRIMLFYRAYFTNTHRLIGSWVSYYF